MRIFAVAALLLALPVAAQRAPVAAIDTGRVSGVADGGVERFLGIPYAAPPVGPLRWRAPQPASRWQGVRAAIVFGHDCMQEPFPSDAAPLGTTPGEDCLTVNVWRPAGAKAGAKLPVLFWIYGGGNVNGGASPAVYSGDAFARDGVIMVSYNLRVGRFGFFGFPALTRADADKGQLANYGYFDSIAALNWVRRNIAAFGGDPAKVTIYGQSAGAGQVAMLMGSPLARGLFARAIIQSGGGGANPIAPFDRAEQAGVAFAKRWQIDGTGAEALARLRALTLAQVTDGIDIGTSAAQRDTFAPVADQARAAYRGDGPDEGHVLREMGRDLSYGESARFIATRMTAQGLPVFAYRFGYVADAMRGEWQEGPPHATDIPYAMDTVRAKYGAALTAADADAAAARTVHGYWVNFVKTGDPNGPGLPHWPAYDAKADRIMVFNPDGSAGAVADPHKARLDAIAAVRGH